jgi:F-type H+-transporting ATPase subunit epsilon
VLPEKIVLDVVTPERRLLTRDVEEVVLPGSEGYLGVRPGHTPLLTALGVGILSWKGGNMVGAIAVSKGYAEILPDRVSVLAEIAELEEEIDVDRAEEARERAEKMLAHVGDPHLDFEQARGALERARNRVAVATRSRAGRT